MTPQIRIRRMGWLAVLTICVILYAMLHFKVNAVHSDVVRAEREIVKLENINLMLETEFITRSSQVRLAAWNRLNFSLKSPTAAQFVGSTRQLAAFGGPRGANAPAPIMLAGLSGDEEMPEFPSLVSPLTGEPVDEALLEPEAPSEGALLTVAVAQSPLRVAFGKPVKVALGDTLP